MNPLDPNTQNNSSVPTSPVPNGQGPVNGVSPSAVQPGAVFHPPSATDQITAAQSAAPGIDSPVAPQSSPQPEVAASYAGSAAPDAAGTALGNNSPLHPEVLAKDLWGGGTPPPEEPAPKAKNPWFKSLWFILLVALLSAGAVAAVFLLFSKPSGDTTVNNSTVNEDYVVTSVPLSDLAADQIISISNDSQLAINGQLRINNSAVIQASEQPTNPEAGMLWYSSANNTLYYYNGTQFVPMSTTIGGVGGTLSVGSGLSLVGNTLQNTGVTSVQGQSGAVNFNAGGGISISGTTISVSGVQQGGVLVGSGGGIGTVLPASPGLCLISNASNLPEFGSCTGSTTVTALNGFSGSISILQGSGITVTPGANTLTIATTGGTGVTALNGGSGGLSIANANLAGQTITINTATSGQLGLVQGDGSTVVINGSGVISIGQSVATSANVTFNQLTLTTDLSVANGGTGASTFATGGLLVGNGASALGVVSASGSGECLLSTGAGTAPTFQSCPVGGNISQGSFQTTDFLVKYDSTTNTITNSIIQDNGTTATVTGNLTVNSGIITGSGSGVTNVNAALLQGFSAASFQPAFVTLGVTSGGTGASTLTANGLLLGNGTSPVTAISPVTAGQCLLSTGTGSAPSFQSCPVGGNVTALSGTAGYLTKFATGGVDIENSDLLVQSGGLQVTAASYYLDIFDGATSTFTIQNTNGGNVANLVVEGSTTSSGGLFVGAGKGITSATGINISAGTNANDNITFETRDSLGNLLSFILPSSGGTGQTICTSGITCATGGGQAVILEPGTGSGTAQATAANRPSIWINRTAGTAEILKLQAGGNDALVVSYDGKVNIGSSTLTGNLLFNNSTNSNSITLTSNAPSSSYTLTLPDTAGANLECLKTNGSGTLTWGTCVAGGSGGGITGSGSSGTIALFNGTQSLTDSIITQPASNLIDVEGNLRLGTVSSLTGQLVLANAGTGFTTSLQSGSGNLADLTFTLPSADGSANQCLKTDGSGVLGFTTCLSGGGAGGGVTELNNISGDVDIVGTANQITVTPGGQNITLSLPQSIATTSAPTFGGLSLTGAGQLTLGNGAGQAGTITVRDGSTANYALIQSAGAFGANRVINIPDADGTLAVSASGNIALSAAGNITFTGTLAVGSGGTGATNAGNARSNLGAAASGANSDITSLSAVATVQNSSGSLTVGNASQTLTLQGGAATKLTATSSGITNELVFATPATSNKTITIPNETGTICLQNSGSCGFLTAAVTSLQGQTGSLSLTAGSGIGIAGLTISNSGVTSLTGTANKISVSGGTGAVTLSVPNNLYLGASGSAAGTLSLYDTDFSARAILQAANLASDRTITIPDADGTLAVSASGNIALSAAGNITFTGTLPIANGGTGVTTTPTNGQLLIGNGTGYTVASLTAGAGVTITPGAGSISIAAPNAGACASCANQALSNLASTGVANDTIARMNAGGTALISSDITDNGTNIVAGSAADNSQTVTLQGGTGSSAISIQSLAAGTISVGTANVANTIQIGNVSNAVSQTISVGNNTSGTALLTLGSLTASSTTTIQGGTGASAISIQQGSGGTISVGTTNAGVLSVGNVGGAGATTIRSGTGGVIVRPANAVAAFQVLQNSTGNALLNADTTNFRVGIGTAAPNSTLQITSSAPASVGSGNGTASSNLLTIDGGAGGATTDYATGGTGGAISLTSGAGGAGTAYGCPFFCNAGTGGSAGAIAIQGGSGGAGSASPGTFGGGVGGAGAAVNISGGNGGSGYYGGAGGSITLQAGTPNAGNGGGAGAAGNISIQPAAGGTVNLATANGNATVQIGNTANAVTQTINVGTNATASSLSTVNIGSTIGTSPVNINAGTSGVTVAGSSTTTTLLTVNTNTITSGTGLAVTNTGTSLTSGDLLKVSQTGSYSAAATISGNAAEVSRAPTSTNVSTSIALATSNICSGSSGSVSCPITISSPNSVLIMSVNGHNGFYPSVGFSGGGLTTLVTPGGGNESMGMYYVINPAVGSYNMTTSGAGWQMVTGSVWTGVDITGGAATAFNTPTAIAWSNGGGYTGVTAASGTGQVVVDAINIYSGASGVGTPSQTNQTTIQATNYSGTTVLWGGQSQRPSQGATTYMAWSGTSMAWNAQAAVALKPASLNGIVLSGPLVNFNSNCIVSGGACTDSSNILNLNQQYASATGAVLNIQNSGTGADIQLGSATTGLIQTAAGTSSTGINVVSGNASAGSSGNLAFRSGTGTTGTGTVTVATGNASAGTSGALTVQTGNGTTSTGAITITSGNASAGSSGNVTIDTGTATTTTGNIFIGNANSMSVQIGNSSAKLGSWANSAGYNLPANRMNHGATVYNGYAYVVGGQSSTNINTATNTVYYAKLKSDGTIPTTGSGVWTATTAISVSGAKNRTATQAVAVNGYLYVVGGFDETTTAQSTVYYAKINSDGTVGSWAATNSLPGVRAHHRSFSANGYIYALGGTTTNAAANAQSTVYYARVNADGTTGAWSSTDPIGGVSAVNRYLGAVTYANGFVYYSGGINQAGTTQSDVYYAKIKTDGTIPTSGAGAWATTNAMVVSGTQARYGHSMVASNGYLYVFGGNNGGTSQSTVYSAAFNADGTIGTWSAQTSQSIATESHSTVVANGYFYHLGGAYPFAATVYNTVYIASTPRVIVASNLDLINSDNSGLTEGGGGGQLTAGNTRIVGTFEVSDQANFMQGVSIGGNLTVGGKGTNANPVFAVQTASGSTALAIDTATNTATIQGDTTITGLLQTIDSTDTVKVKSDSATSFLVTKADGTTEIFKVDNSASIAVVTINGTLTLNGRIITSGSAPSTAVNANAGTGASCTVNGNDTAGTITLTSGSGAWATGTQCTLTFNGGAWASAPRVLLTPASTGTNARQVYGTTTTTTFTVDFDSADSGANVHTINYIILR